MVADESKVVGDVHAEQRHGSFVLPRIRVQIALSQSVKAQQHNDQCETDNADPAAVYETAQQNHDNEPWHMLHEEKLSVRRTNAFSRREQQEERKQCALIQITRQH